MTFQDLLAYKKSFFAWWRFWNNKIISKETYSNSFGRNVPVTMAEAYRKNLPKILYSKLTDSDGENFETQVARICIIL
jgi:hypothetical protein